MEFFRQKYWGGLPCPLLGDLPNPGIESTSLCLLHWQAGSLPLVPPGKPGLKTIGHINHWFLLGFWLFLRIKKGICRKKHLFNTLCFTKLPFSSVTQSFLTLWDPVACSTPGFPVLHQFPEPSQTHVPWVSDAIQPSHPRSSPSPPAKLIDSC